MSRFAISCFVLSGAICLWNAAPMMGSSENSRADSWLSENYRGITVRYQTPEEQQAGRIAADYLLSKEPYATDSRQIKSLYSKWDLHEPKTGQAVSGYELSGSIYVDASEPQELGNTAAHELGHVIRGASESQADAYAGLPHDFSRWAGVPYAQP